MFIAGPEKENGQFMLKRPELSMAFREGLSLKGSVWDAGDMTFFWLGGDEVTGWCLKNLNH